MKQEPALALELPGLELPELAAGSVWLVGAGPGDPGLLSLLAVHALRQADVVVYDALVDQRALALARRGAELDYAGKRGGRPSPQQPDISLRLAPRMCAATAVAASFTMNVESSPISGRSSLFPVDICP